MWSDKGTLSESDDVTLRDSDDRTEFTHHILEDIEEENLETLKNEKENENAKHLDTDLNEEPRRIRKLTEKGEEEKIRRLKQQRTNALTAVSRKRTDINKLMTNRRNLDVVKAELNQLDSLRQQFHDTHKSYHDQLATSEETEIASRYFYDKESDIFEHCKEVTNWILECEAKISNHLERLSDKRSAKSCSSRSSRSSRSLQSARMKEKAKVAELMAERSLLREKIKLQAAEEQLQIYLKIAKAKAREKAFEELEKEQKLKLAEVTDESHDSFLALPTPATGRKHEQPSIPGNSPICSTGVKVKREEREFSPFNPEKSEFYYHAFPAETKKEDVTHLTNTENEMLKEVFKIQHEQIQGMVASQHHLATAIALTEPEVRKFKGDPSEFKTFLMAFDARVQSRVTNSTDRLYYLDQHLIGEPKELISGCLHIELDEGYKEARRLLQKGIQSLHSVYEDPNRVATSQV